MTKPAKKTAPKKAAKKTPAKTTTLPAGEVVPDNRHWAIRVTPPEIEALSTTLTPEEVSAMADRMAAESALFGTVRKFRVRRPRTEIPRMTVGNVAKGKTPAGTPVSEELPAGVEVDLDYESVVISTTSIVLPWTVTEEFLQDNPDGGRVGQLVGDMMVTQLANDAEDLAVNGDEDKVKDVLYRANDGWIKLAREHGNLLTEEVPAGTTMTFSALERIVRAMPLQYRRNKEHLRLFMGTNAYMDLVQARAARLGDAADNYLSGKVTGVSYGGIPVVMSPYMPEGTILLSDPQNLVFALQDDVKVRASWGGRESIMRDERYYALHARMDFVIQNPEAVVLYERTIEQPVPPTPSSIHRLRVRLATWIHPDLKADAA